MNYASYVTTMQTMLVIYDPTGVTNLNNILPDMINYAELRIYRDLQLLNTVTSGTAALSTSNRNINLPAPTGGTFIVIESANLVLPAGTTNPDNGQRLPLQRVSKEYINYAYGSASPSQPVCYANINDSQIVVGPPSDNNYTIEFLGTYRPNPLSATNTTTILTQFFSDLFIAASMVFGAGYQRDFGHMSDDPQMAQSWENQYNILKSSAMNEEFMKKAQSQGWQAFQPTTATPPRS